MTMSRSAKSTAATAQLQVHANRLRCAGNVRKLRHQARLTPAQRELIVALMMEREGLAGACARADIPLGLVLAERQRNPRFRQALAAAERQRLEVLEMLLTDVVLRGLLPGSDAPASEAREKFLSGLAQALLEKAATRKTASGGKPAKRGAGGAPVHADELGALLAETERRIAEAEVELGALPAPGAPELPPAD